MSDLRGRLKIETSELHNLLEQELQIMDPKMSLEKYVHLLRGFYGFYIPIEGALAAMSASHAAARFYVQDRIKAPWINEDLENLNGSSNINFLNSNFLESPRDKKLWGLVYVIEGSTLGGQIIIKNLTGKYGLDADYGLRFFSSYRERTGIRWQKFLTELNAQATSAKDHDDIVDGAKWTFKLLLDWFKSQNSVQSLDEVNHA